MNKVLILVEGQAEETFVKELFVPHLSSLNVEVNTVVVTTKFDKGNPTNYRGGINSMTW